jgi:hypothetical protein
MRSSGIRIIAADCCRGSHRKTISIPTMLGIKLWLTQSI